jgi:hypothetical protein
MDRNQEHITPSQHSDTPPDRPERKTGTGREATQGTVEPVDEHDTEHRSGYGGKGGTPDTSSDQR